MSKTLQELYEIEKRKPTSAAQFIARLAEATKSSEVTVRTWIAGKQTPDALKRAAIASELGAAESDLFPVKQ